MHPFSGNLFVVAGLAALGIAGANAAGNGSSPEGKPCVSINNQIVEVTGAISLLQDQLNALLQAKQNLINGTCPSGPAIRQIMADGSVVCESISGGASGAPQTTHVAKRTDHVNSGRSTGISATCPAGWLASHAGYCYAFNWQVVHSYSRGSSAFLCARNNNPCSSFMYVQATCMRIAP